MYSDTISLDQYSTPRRRSCLETVLLLGFVLCIIVGLGALGTLWLFYATPAATQTANPLGSLQTARILPQLALMELAGDPTTALAYQALNANELETSRSLLIFGLHKTQSSQIGLLLQLARRFAADSQSDVAAMLYHQARALAILDTDFTPFDRTQTLLLCAEGFLAIQKPEEALDAAQQAKLIATQTPDLLPAQRSQLFQDLTPIAKRLADVDFHQQIAELVRNPYLSPIGELLPISNLQISNLQTREIMPLPADLFPVELMVIIQQREQLARQLAERIILTNGADIEPERRALVQALLAEDQNRTAQFNQISASQNLTLSLQFTRLKAQNEWLLIKLKIAQKAYGISLIPEWEDNATLIAQALTSVIADQQSVQLKFAQTQPAPAEQLLQRAVALQWLALQIELGYYIENNPANLGDQLRAVQGDLAQQKRPLALPVEYSTTTHPPSFRIIPTP